MYNLLYSYVYIYFFIYKHTDFVLLLVVKKQTQFILKFKKGENSKKYNNNILKANMKRNSFINKKELNKSMGKKFNILIEKGQDGYLISEVIELPGCHTQAKSLDELLKRTKEAISLYLSMKEESADLPVEFIGLQQLEV